MNCPNCGHENEAGAKACVSCGKPLGSGDTDGKEPSSASLQRGRGGLILTFGILSVLLVGFISGIPAWVMGHRDLKKIRAGIIAPVEKGVIRWGMILGIVGTFVSVPVLVFFGSGFFFGYSTFKAEAQKANREYMIRELGSFAAEAQQYYRDPKSAGGGGDSFVGFSLSARGDTSTRSGFYQITENPPAVSNYRFSGRSDADPSRVIITGWGRETGKDGIHKVQAYITVDSSMARTTVLN